MFRGRFTIALAGAVAGLAIVGSAAAAGAGGVVGPGFYVDGELYRTVVTPAQFTETGAPDSSFDTIYAFPGGTQPYNVAEAAPGDSDFNGGRWIVKALTFDDHDELTLDDYATALDMFDANGSGNFDSAEEVEAAIDAGLATAMEVTRFECPVIRVPGGHS